MTVAASGRRQGVCGGIQVCLLALALLGPAPAFAAQTIKATVTHVVNGDTAWAEDANGTKLRVRLVGIDAPEVGHARRQGGRTPGQPWGEEARRLLAALVLREPVTVEVYGRDRRGPILGVLRRGETNVNLHLVQSGLAWFYRGGRNDAPAALMRELEAAEVEARRAVRGLWADANPEPPWRFRKRMRLGRS